MTGPEELSKKDTALFRRHPVVAYFILTFTISWLGALAVAAPHLLRDESLPRSAVVWNLCKRTVGFSGYRGKDFWQEFNAASMNAREPY
jgi:hypothetical protein